MSTPAHWDAAYAQGDRDRGWYQAQARMSMRMLAAVDVSPPASLVDIGGGASVLVDDLLDAGYDDITVVDLSATGLDISRARLGARADRVEWVVADLLEWQPRRTYDVWHDRAVLHFLLDPAEQSRYRAALLRATHAGSVAIIGVFSRTGPEWCSGLPVHRYDVAALAQLIGPEFTIVATEEDVHVKPSGETQDYLWVAARRPD